jgi:hypothetical protein
LAAADFWHNRSAVRIVALTLCVLACAARAEDEGPRARWAFGLTGGCDLTYSGTGDAISVPGMGGGLFTRAGLQWNERLHIEVDVSAATLVFFGFARGAVLAGLTYDWITLSLGPVLATNYFAVLGPGSTHANTAGVAGRVDFNFWRHVADSGRRWAITASISADAGVALQEFSGSRASLNGFAWGAYTSIGPTWY